MQWRVRDISCFPLMSKPVWTKSKLQPRMDTDTFKAGSAIGQTLNLSKIPPMFQCLNASVFIHGSNPFEPRRRDEEGVTPL